MKKPEIEVVRFGAEDVIATSGAPKLVTWASVGQPYGDSIVSFGGNDYGLTQGEGKKDAGAAASALLNYNGYSNVAGDTAKVYTRFMGNVSGNYSKNFAFLFEDNNTDDTFNATYKFEKFDGTFYWFYKQ